MKTESPGSHNRYAVTGRLLVDGRLAPGALVVDGGRIVEVRTGTSPDALPEPRIEAEIVSPGLVDLQVNGGFGVEVGGDAALLRTLATRLPATGVTTFLPTVVSGDAASYRGVAAALAAARVGPPDWAGARMPGLHLEGPLLSPARAGAHDAAPIAAADATLDGVLPELLAAGAVRLVTLAPERPGALARIAALRQAGVTVSLGHTDASFDQAVAGIDAGATMFTHLFNAMSPFAHRAPGAAGAALTDERVAVGLIADGIHTHAAALNLALRAKGPERIALVTDAVAAAAAPPGRYALAGRPVVSDGQTARLEDGTLAGSILTMDRAVRVMVTLGGARLEDALAMASTVPAALVGLAPTGRLAAGLDADLVLWSASLEVEAAIVRGEVAFSRR
jgi:N-acetylglucosamine-6-phosphate deacetylase